jgi:hypothetical protein
VHVYASYLRQTILLLYKQRYIYTMFLIVSSFQIAQQHPYTILLCQICSTADKSYLVKHDHFPQNQGKVGRSSLSQGKKRPLTTHPSSIPFTTRNALLGPRTTLKKFGSRPSRSASAEPPLRVLRVASLLDLSIPLVPAPTSPG